MAIQVSVSLCLIVIPIALSVLLSSLHFAIASNEIGNSLITETCNQTEFPDVCISTLESDPRSSNANLTDLSKIGFELTVTKSNETLAEAFKLLNNASSYEQWGRRSACYSTYKSSVNQIKEGLQYFNEKKYDEANRIVGLYNEGLSYCLNLEVVELTERITFLKKFTTDLKVILHLLY
ncbi:pectinesterase inhibitor [Fagus crenata]